MYKRQVLGNEIRLGIERYIKNTLETDAEITIRNLDKFAKNYIERIAVNPVDLSSQQFLRLYHHALSGDLTKVKCLVDADGKILDMSRDGVEGPSLSLIVEKDDTNYSVGIDFSSLSQKDLEKLEKVIIQHQNSQLDISIDVHIGQYNRCVYETVIRLFFRSQTRLCHWLDRTKWSWKEYNI